MNGGPSQADRVLIGAFKDKLPEPEPTLAELALRAVRAAEAEHAYEIKGAEDVTDIALWDARNEAFDAFFAELEAKTRIDRKLFEQIAGLA